MKNSEENKVHKERHFILRGKTWGKWKVPKLSETVSSREPDVFYI